MIPEPDDVYLSGAYAEVVMTVLDEADFLSTAWWPLKLVPRVGLPLPKSETDEPCQWVKMNVSSSQMKNHGPQLPSLVYDKYHSPLAKVLAMSWERAAHQDDTCEF